MKILLIQPNESLDLIMGKGKHFAQPLPPVGLLYIASNLRKYGHNVSILDAYFNNLSVDEVQRHTAQVCPDIIGISCLTSNGIFVYHLCNLIKNKNPKIYIVLGNFHASHFASFFIRKCRVDFVVHGEGEEIMVELLQAIEEGKSDFFNIKGLSWYCDSEVIHNPLRPVNRNLDVLPYPARDLIPFEKYLSGSYGIAKQNGNAMVISSRGCVNRCKFCCVNQGGKIAFRSSENVVNELKALVQSYNVSFISFADPLFTANRKRTFELCESILKANLKLKWWCEGHARFIDKDILKIMKRAGCVSMSYGIESGVQKIIDSMGKKSNLYMIQEAVNLTHEAGIEVSGLFILGWFNESVNDVKTTLKFALNLPLDTAQFAIAVPYPGSLLYEDLIAADEIKLFNEDDPHFYKDWLRYSSYISYTKNEPVWVPKKILANDLKNLQKYCVRRFYLRPKQLWHQIKKMDFTNIDSLSRLFRAALSSMI